jgi:hypothetical protein
MVCKIIWRQALCDFRKTKFEAVWWIWNDCRHAALTERIAFKIKTKFNVNSF